MTINADKNSFLSSSNGQKQQSYHQRTRSLPIVIPSFIQKLQTLDNWRNSNSEITRIIITKLEIEEFPREQQGDYRSNSRNSNISNDSHDSKNSNDSNNSRNSSISNGSSNSTSNSAAIDNGDGDCSFRIRIELIDHTWWSVIRSYSQLNFWYHNQLLEVFPIEGGLINSCYQRQIPELPKKPPWLLSLFSIIGKGEGIGIASGKGEARFGREKRRRELIKRLNGWMDELSRIQPYIARSRVFVSFWLPTDKDTEMGMGIKEEKNKEIQGKSKEGKDEELKLIIGSINMERRDKKELREIEKRQKLKIKTLDNEIYIIDHLIRNGIENLKKSLMIKDGIECKEFAYIDNENDLITVIDDEDLEIAIKVQKITNLIVVE